MTNVVPGADSPQKQPDASDGREQSSLARVLARRATDLFAISVVLVGVLAVSGRLADWWETDPNDVLRPDQTVAGVAGTQTSWGAGETSVALRLGQLPLVMHRQVLVGDEERVFARLRQNCRELLEASHRERLLLPPTGENEMAILLGLDALVPIEQAEGKWKLYRVDQPGSFVVGQLLIGIRESSPNAPLGSMPELVCWAMAIPKGEAQWTLFTFERTTTGTEVTSKVPIPPDARLTLSVADPSGGQMVGFEATLGTSEEAALLAGQWAELFEAELHRENWKLARDWARKGSAYSARFERQDEVLEIQWSALSNKLIGLANTINRPGNQPIP